MSKTIGILGGMGPGAAVQMFHFIVKNTKANRDQDHLPIIIINNPKIPDRTAAILGDGESPLPLLVASAKLLEEAGADFIIIPCNTAHHYYDRIMKHVGIPILHLHNETRDYLTAQGKRYKRIGLLATTGTIKTKLFDKSFNQEEVEIIVPTPKYQNQVMEAVYGPRGIKAGFKDHPKELLQKVIDHLKTKKVDAVLSGCTDISLVITPDDLPLPLIDPLEIISRIAINKAGYICR